MGATLMCHETSGREDYERLKVIGDSLPIDRKTLILMLKEEETQRFSQEFLSRCDQLQEQGDPNPYITAIDEMQLNIAAQFGFGETARQAVNTMRTAHTVYRDDPEVQAISVYSRENKSHKGSLKPGDQLPDLKLFTPQLKQTNLQNLVTESGITLLLASSLS
mmetsp:Transcript_62955/g.72230  ORF Transcript_62955/g.72230 Transcript_62955/m.72230 type:complete len:163 (-) Transcript_62955:744-1232(-)